MAYPKWVVIGRFDHDSSSEVIVVSREMTAPSREAAEELFKMAFEDEGMGTPDVESCYGPYNSADVPAVP